ncbi:MAG: hypothetical protein QNJ55_09385 [Xenococcus sp. MO_188.B8]|nr:hypothetical protein [Xenococcus sp. MO_188.B8]
MNNKLVYLTALTLQLTIINLGIGSRRYLARTQPMLNRDDNCEIVSEITRAKGVVKIKRPGESAFQSVKGNIKLCRGYLIKPVDETVYLKCIKPKSAMPKRLLVGYLSSAELPCERELNQCPGGPCRGGEEDFHIPLIITTGRFLNNRPKLRWLPVIDTKYYSITVSGKGVNWKASVNDDHITYDGPQLQQGQSYLIRVESINGDEKSDFSDETTLIMITEKEAMSFQNANAQIAAKDLANTVKDLEMAQLYIEYDLRVEAIEILKQLAPDVNGSEKISIYNTISKLYHDMGFYGFEESYKLEAQEVEGR